MWAVLQNIWHFQEKVVYIIRVCDYPILPFFLFDMYQSTYIIPTGQYVLDCKQCTRNHKSQLHSLMMARQMLRAAELMT